MMIFTTVLALLVPCSGFEILLPRSTSSAYLRRSRTINAIEPVTTVAAFAAGLLPPSLLLAGKEREVQEAKEETALAQAELSRLREGFTGLIKTMELEIDLADTELDALLAAGSRAAQKRQEELVTLREKYDTQLKQLKELLGDYTDKLELQQNSFKRLSTIAESARSESLALKERAKLLEDRLKASNAQLEKVTVELQEMAEVNANPFARFFKAFER